MRTLAEETGDDRQFSEDAIDSKSLTLGPSGKGFAIGLYLEHLEEASFLYDQRLTLFYDPEITWLDIDDFEERFEAHIDALFLGEELALKVCKQQTTEGDFGELHAAGRVFCRQDRLDLLVEVLKELDLDDDERVQAVADALRYEMPLSWRNEVFRILSEGDERAGLKPVPAVLAKIIGYRRLDAGTLLLGLLQGDSEAALPMIIWALGRLRERSAAPLLLDYLGHEDGEVCYAAALALLRMGETRALNGCLQSAHVENWALIPVGLAGGRSTSSVLLRVAYDSVSPECLMALGLLGDISVVSILLDHLEDEELAEYAAIGLNLITGAEIYEEAFIPEEIDEDELFEDELEAYRRGEYPPPDEEPPGITIERLSQNQEEWRKWWEENGSSFRQGIRYRNGKPYSPACLLENLEAEKCPNKVRRLVYEELVIRYNADFPFEIDMPVAEQKQVLAKYLDWIRANGSRFREGYWYFAGRMLSV